MRLDKSDADLFSQPEVLPQFKGVDLKNVKKETNLFRGYKFGQCFSNLISRHDDSFYSQS